VIFSVLAQLRSKSDKFFFIFSIFPSFSHPLEQRSSLGGAVGVEGGIAGVPRVGEM